MLREWLIPSSETPFKSILHVLDCPEHDCVRSGHNYGFLENLPMIETSVYGYLELYNFVEKLLPNVKKCFFPVFYLAC